MTQGKHLAVFFQNSKNDKKNQDEIRMSASGTGNDLKGPTMGGRA